MSLQPVVVAYPCGPPKMPMEIHPAFMEAHGSCRWSEDEEGTWCLYCGHKIEPVGFVEPNSQVEARDQ